MAVDIEEPDYGNVSSCPTFGMSTTRSASGRSWRSSDAVKDDSVDSGSRLRRVGTETTLAEQYENSDGTLVHGKKEDREMPLSSAKKNASLQLRVSWCKTI
jgi:nicotinamide N-methyltransferase